MNIYPGPGATHAALAGYWGTEAARFIGRAVADPTPRSFEDLDLNHVVRCAKQAGYHALMARPDLRPPREY